MAEGDNTFTLAAVDNQSRNGQATTKVTLDSISPTVSFSSPANNCSFATMRTDVSGSFTEASIRSVTVNGISAFINGSSWTALNVPLALGANTITATAQDIAGNTGQATMTIYGAANPLDPVQLSAAPIGGFAPLQVLFTSAASILPGQFSRFRYHFDGDGVIDQTTSAPGQLWHTYNSPGEFFPVVSVVTTAGRFSSPGGWKEEGSRLKITVQYPPALASAILVADPVDLKVTPDGNIYVLSSSTATITEFSSAGAVLRSATAIGNNPSGLDVDAGGNVYVAVTGDNQVKKFVPTTGSFQADGGFNGVGYLGKADRTAGTGSSEFNGPFDVAVTPDGTEIDVSDSGNHRIQRFSLLTPAPLGGALIGSFGQCGAGFGQFNAPKGLAFDDLGRLYIIDSGNNRIALAAGSDVIGVSGIFGNSLGQFSAPVNLGVGGRGLYVADTANNRIQGFETRTGCGVPPVPFDPLFSSSGQLGLNNPKGVASVPDLLAEKIYIADTGNGRNSRDTADGKSRGRWTAAKSGS